LKALDLVIGGIRARLMKRKAQAGLYLNADMITENLWIGGVNPPELIISEGFNAVVDLREEVTDDYRKFLESHGVDYLNVKIPDREGASPEVLSKIVGWIEKKIREGKKILVHCNLGRGRSALIVTAYLVSNGMRPEEAMDIIKKKRRVVFINDQQKKALYEFANVSSSSSHYSKSVNDENKPEAQEISILFVKKNLPRLLLSIALSLGILYYVFFEFIDIKRFIQSILYISLPFLIISDLPYAIQTMLYSYRLKLGLHEAGYNVRYSRVYWSHLFGMFWSNFALGKLGYYAAALPLRRKIKISESTGVISAIQSLDLAVKGVAAVLGLFALSQLINIQEVRFWVLIMAGGFILLGAIFLALVWRENLPFNLNPSKIPFIGSFIQSFKDSSYMVRGIAVEIVIFAIIGWFLRGVEWFLLSYACGIYFPFIICFFLHPLLTIIRMIPFTFSGLGVLEFALIKLFPMIPPEKLVLFGMLDMINNVFFDVLSLKELKTVLSK